MVSFHSSLSPHQLLGRRSKNLQNPDFFEMSLPKKRKRLVEEVSERSQTRIINSLLGIELPLLAPLPLEWQRCLDIKVCIKVLSIIRGTALSRHSKVFVAK
ncbi:unnamed protein product [Cuscuta epithymum]|uniref:Uncharacterized protein n=1 Tax=Cuscuta epithymum TaxID=186058 RepID=A0AAV0EYG9_9ASTE|nr:unnamed protein product [Cuscuta epithymum]